MAWNDNISGTGTQADPYQVTTVEQFEGALAQRGAYLKIMNNIDFGGISKRYTFSARYVDGNGKILSNFYVLNNTIFNLPQLYDGADPQEERKREFKNATLEFVIVSYLTRQMDPDNYSKYAGVAACYNYDGTNNTSTIDKWRNHDPNLIFTDCDVRIKYYGAIDSGNDGRLDYNRSGSIFCRQRKIILNMDIMDYPRIILNAYNSVFSIDAYMLLPHNGSGIFSSYTYSTSYGFSDGNAVAGIVDNCVVKINLYDKFGWNEEYTSNENMTSFIVGHFNIISNTAFHINYIAKAKLHNNTYCNILGYVNNLYNSYFVLNYPSFLSTAGFQATRFSTISFVATDHGKIYKYYCEATYDIGKQIKLVSFEDAKNRETLESIGFVLKHTT